MLIRSREIAFERQVDKARVDKGDGNSVSAGVWGTSGGLFLERSSQNQQLTASSTATQQWAQIAWRYGLDAGQDEDAE